MKPLQIIFSFFILLFLASCHENLEPKYKEISGTWKFESAELKNKSFVEDSLIKFNILEIPYHKFSNRKRSTENIKYGLYIVNDSTKNLNPDQKFIQGYKLRSNGNIEFQYIDPAFGFPKNNVLTQIIFQGNWYHRIEGEQLILIRHNLLSDSLGGLKLVYKRI
jgi:hypothetical protein